MLCYVRWFTRVEAGSNTSTVTLRVVGGNEKGSLKSETVKYGRESQGTRSENNCAGKGHQHIRKTDPSSRQRGRPPKKQDRNCQTVINIWSWASDGARHQDLLTEWPSVAMWFWLWLWLRHTPGECFIPRLPGRLTVGRKVTLTTRDSWHGS
jgi:hypothetical protein